MKRPQFDVGFAYCSYALARRAEEARVRLAANGVECASRFEVAGRSASEIADDASLTGTAPTEPALPIWRSVAARAGSVDKTSEPPRTSGLVVIRGPLTRGRR